DRLEHGDRLALLGQPLVARLLPAVGPTLLFRHLLDRRHAHASWGSGRSSRVHGVRGVIPAMISTSACVGSGKGEASAAARAASTSAATRARTSSSSAALISAGPVNQASYRCNGSRASHASISPGGT